MRDFTVRIDPELRVRVDGLVAKRAVDIPVAAKADVDRHALFLRDDRLLRQVDGGGRAIASLFRVADRRPLAQAWLAACVAAEDGRTAQRLELAAQQAAEEQARNDREMQERLAAFGRDVAERHGRAGRRQPQPRSAAGAGDDTAQSGPEPTAPPAPKPRILVDPSTLTVANAFGRTGGEGWGRSGQRGDAGRSPSPLPPPNRNAPPPRGTASAPSFTPLDKESVGMELARKALGGDADEIADIRAQRGVGADAVDGLDRFFELKVHLGDEPDTIRLEESEIRRALSTPDFFLVIVSNIEGANARPKVRIIVDPVHQLYMTQSSSVSFTGVRSVENSLVYDFNPLPQAEGE